jgi:hypothetical protein
MFGSDHDGERAAAAAKADKIVRGAGLTWAQILTPPQAGGKTYPAGEPGQPSWRGDLALAQRHLSICSAWERTFIASIARQRTITAKQWVILGQIAEALRARGLP